MSRAGSQATVFIIDKSSAGPLPDSREYLTRTIHPKLVSGRKTDIVSILSCADDQTANALASGETDDGYMNIFEVFPLAQPEPSILPLINQIQPSQKNGIVADLMAAIIIAVFMLDQCKVVKPSWSKEIQIISQLETPIDQDSFEQTAAKAKEMKVVLKFCIVDNPNSKQSDIKRNNMIFLTKKFLPLIPNSEIVSLNTALDLQKRPQIKQVNPTAARNRIRLGDQDKFPGRALDIPVRILKGTAKQAAKSTEMTNVQSVGTNIISGSSSALSQSLGVKTVGQSADSMANGGVWVERRYFFQPEKYAKENHVTRENEDDALYIEDEEEVKPETIEVNEIDIRKVWRFGATLIPFPEEDEGGLDELALPQGLDILCFIPVASFRREYLMGEVYFILATIESEIAQTTFSALAEAMISRGTMAICRYCRTNNSKSPIMVGLFPYLLDGNQPIFHMIRVPFAEDYRKYQFPTLLNQKMDSKMCPNSEQQTAMDNFVDSMNLEASKDEIIKLEEGCGMDRSWFEPELSFNPSLHRLQEALFHGLISGGSEKHPIGAPHSSITQYFESPMQNKAKVKLCMTELSDLIPVKMMPPKKKQNKGVSRLVEPAQRTVDLKSLLGLVPSPAPLENAKEDENLESKKSFKEEISTITHEQISDDSQTEDES